MGHPPLRGRVVTEAPKHCVVPVPGRARLGPLKLAKRRGWGEVVRMGEERGCDSGETLVSQETFPDTPLCAPPLILFHPLTALIKIITTQLVVLSVFFMPPSTGGGTVSAGSLLSVHVHPGAPLALGTWVNGHTNA